VACENCGAPDDQGCYIGCASNSYLFKGQGIDAKTKGGQFTTLRSDIYAPGGKTFSFLGDPDGYVVKDSGVRQEYPSGMRRDTQEGKPNYALLPREFLKRWAIHLTKGAEKYGRENWRLANSQEELDRFKDSAFRHFMQWLDGEVDEDHASAIAFNVACAEYVKEKLKNGK
jgi:hypothetical protein